MFAATWVVSTKSAGCRVEHLINIFININEEILMKYVAIESWGKILH